MSDQKMRNALVAFVEAWKACSRWPDTSSSIKRLDMAFEKAEAVLSAPAGEQVGLTGWQPIETAPKDGTSIFVSNGIATFPAAAFYSEVDQRWYWSNSGAWAGPIRYWMPIPALPAAHEAKRNGGAA